MGNQRLQFITLFFLIGGLLLSLPAYSQVLNDKITREAIAGEYIVAIRSGNNKSVNLQALGFPNAKAFLKKPIENGTLNLVKIKTKNQKTNRINALANRPDVDWVAPNYQYFGDPREMVSNDPLASEQYHHAIMQNPAAWQIAQGQKDIIVAVTDDGVELEHEDLKHSIWVNEGEIPNNGIDDDQNGYVDDVNGWDFSSKDNDPNPAQYYLRHGTHVAGIIAGAINNSVGIAGTAPNVTIMPIRFYGSGAWTSEVIAKSYMYAADNGAHIINTSYNADGLADDRVVIAALDYVYDKGVIHFNSAGNGNNENSPRVKLEQLLLVCSTIADNVNNDRRSNFSNYGTGVDICAPGGGGEHGIYSTITNNRYRRLSGTSMAAPNAAAVTALIWSQNPDWNREQVLAQLFSTSDDIHDLNSQYFDKLGAGRVNSYRALSEETMAPTIRDIEFYNGKVRILTKSIFDPISIHNTDSWQLVSKDTGETIAINLVRDYRMGTNIIEFEPEKSLTPGEYIFTAFSDYIVDPFGTNLDGNDDGIAGGDLSYTFKFP